MTWIVTALAWGKNGLSWLWGLISRYPWPAACLALVLACWWLWDAKADAQADLAAEKKAHADDIAKWQDQVKQVQVARDKAKTDAKEAATDAQETHDKLAADNAGLEQYIRDHRVQDRQCPAASAGAGAGGAASIPTTAPESPIVAVSEADLRTCDSAWSYAQSAYEFGQTLKAKGLAVDGK